MEIVQFENWKFEVDKTLTIETYSSIAKGGADSCSCTDCKNYIVNRENIFPNEIKQLFLKLGIDYNKEVEILSYQVLPNGLHHIAGWFHFKGRIIEGKDCRIPVGNNGSTYNLTNLGNNFSIGFCKQSSLTFFKDKDGLIQVEFEAHIPWLLDKLEIL